MIELNKEQYKSCQKIRELIKELKSDTVYIHSILEGRQQGRIFVDDLSNVQNVLIWHYCTFAFVAGSGKNPDFNNDLGRLLRKRYEENQKKVVLAIADDKWRKVVEEQNQSQEEKVIKESQRYKFKFNRALFESRKWEIPEGYELREIDKDVIVNLQGRIIPSFSWESQQAFLEKGKGMCLLHNGDIASNSIACNAFSAAIGDGQMDIGIETNPEYRGKGLGKVIAAQMVKYALSQGYEPIWGCDTRNIGSLRIAEAVGFEVVGKHYMYMR